MERWLTWPTPTVRAMCILRKLKPVSLAELANHVDASVEGVRKVVIGRVRDSRLWQGLLAVYGVAQGDELYVLYAVQRLVRLLQTGKAEDALRVMRQVADLPACCHHCGGSVHWTLTCRAYQSTCTACQKPIH